MESSLHNLAAKGTGGMTTQHTSLMFMKWKSDSDLLSNAHFCCKSLVQAMQSNFKVGLGWPFPVEF